MLAVMRGLGLKLVLRQRASNFLFLFLLATSSLFSENRSSIVFIHIGKEIPRYLQVAVDQAKLFNPDISIYVCANRRAIGVNELIGVQLVDIESLNSSSTHKRYEKRKIQKNFWRYTLERFFILEELMTDFHLENVVHLESDVMLYESLNNLMPVLKSYSGIGVPFDTDDRAIPSFVYVKDIEAIRGYNQFIINKFRHSINDMKSFGAYFSEKQGIKIHALPVVPVEYCKHGRMNNLKGVSSKYPLRYSYKVGEFNAVFDAAAIGQYLGGIDPIHTPKHTVGYVNMDAMYRINDFTFEWSVDQEGRRRPYMSYNGQTYPIINLHIHSKRLEEFRSDVH